jgi:exo beta-1,2-glucooligosaccharide sophorohydrolase (non-reducing end)
LHNREIRPFTALDATARFRLDLRRLAFCRFASFLLVGAPLLHADSAYFQRLLFDNSITADSYYHSGGKASALSTLRLLGDRLPVETNIFYTGPNALRLDWASKAQGGWEAEIRVDEWRNRKIYFPGDTLYFWCYAPAPIRATDLPRIVLKDEDKNFTRPLDLGPITKDIPAGKWVQIEVPLDRFSTASVHVFEPHRTSSVFFIQGSADNVEHSLIVDEVKIDSAAAVAQQSKLPVPEHVQAKGYERHVDVSWTPVDDKNLARYVIYRSLDGAPFRPIGIQVPGIDHYEDFLGKPDKKAAYKIKASNRAYGESDFSAEASASTHAMTDDELLTMVQEACFRYYWDGAHPVSGMTRENTPGNDDIVATGASGFGIMALVVGADRGFVTRAQAVERLLKITSFLAKADRFHGAWPHFLNGATGKRMPVFGMYDNGADLVETSFLMEGLLAARQYFRGASESEQKLDRQITDLWKTVEWDWFRRTENSGFLYWHWSPEYSWHINHRLTGWNEVMITYLLAVASPAHGVPASLYYTGWTGIPGEYVNGHTYFGIKLDVGIGTGGPLFFTDYSYMGFDPRGLRDRFTNYFDNNRNMARINRAYCIKNPGYFKGYGENCWGITAVDGPEGYVAYEPTLRLDDGTIAPTGALAAFPYMPKASMQALRYFYRELGDRLWGEYGFRDAFNQQEDWFSRIYMGLNQAPIVVMIENYRTGLVWKNFMANPEIQPMLDRIGFKPDETQAAQ